MARARRGWIFAAGIMAAWAARTPAFAQEKPANCGPGCTAGVPSLVDPSSSCGGGCRSCAGSQAGTDGSAQARAEREARRTQDNLLLEAAYVGFPQEFEEAPLGASLYAHGRTQVANGEAARMVLYHYDFIEGTPQLNPRGKDQLHKIACLLPINFCPVVVERTLCAPELDESRRWTVWHELCECSFPIPSERVVVGAPIAVGLKGVEAEIVYRNLLIQTQTRGAAVGGAGGAAGGAPGFAPAVGGAPR